MPFFILRRWRRLRKNAVWGAMVVLLALSISYLYGAWHSIPPSSSIGKHSGNVALVLASVIGIALIALGFPPVTSRLHRIGHYWLHALTFVSVGAFVGLAITSGNLVSVSAFVWLTFAGTLAGYQATSWLKIADRPGVERLVTGVTFGFGVLSLLGMILSLAGLLSPIALISALLLITILFRKNLILLANDSVLFYREIETRLATRNKLIDLIYLTIVIICLVIVYIEALVPEFQFDAVYYHLPVPKVYLEQGQLIEMPYSFRSYLPKGFEMLFLLGLGIGNHSEIAAKLFSFAAMVVPCLYLYAFVRNILKRIGISALAIALFATAPLIAWSGSTAYVDVGMTMFAFAAVYSYFRWREEKSNGWLALIGFFGGYTLSIKVQAVFIVTPLFIFIGFELLRTRRWTVALRQLAWLIVPAIVVGLPWYLITFLWTGNPLYPLYNRIFRSPYWHLENPMFTQALYGLGVGPPALLALFWNITFHGDWFYQGVFGTVLLGIPFLMAPFWPFVAFQTARYRRVYPLLLLLLATSAFLWALTIQNLRYLLFALPIVALLTASTFDVVEHRIRRITRRLTRNGIILVLNTMCLAILSLSLILTVNTWWNIPDTIPIALVLGLESRELYMGNVPEYAAADSLSRPGFSPTVLTIGTTDHAHFPWGVEAYPYIDSGILRSWVTSGNDDTQTATRLRRLGISHIVVNTNVSSTLFHRYLLDETFVQNYLVAESAVGDIVVFRLRPVSVTNEAPQPNEIGMTIPSQSDDTSTLNHLDCSDLAEAPESCKAVVTRDMPFVQYYPVIANGIYRLEASVISESPDASLLYGVRWSNVSGDTIDTSFYVRSLVMNQEDTHLIYAQAPQGATLASLIVVSRTNSTVMFWQPIMRLAGSATLADAPEDQFGTTPRLSVTEWHWILQCAIEKQGPACAKLET
ncbi:MAG: glycosyltransferase family 39 protein [Anaerolineae bacterium]